MKRKFEIFGLKIAITNEDNIRTKFVKRYNRSSSEQKEMTEEKRRKAYCCELCGNRFTSDEDKVSLQSYKDSKGEWHFACTECGGAGALRYILKGSYNG